MKGETAVALAAVIATALVGLAGLWVSRDNQVSSLRAEIVRGDRAELRQVLDEVVANLARAVDVGTNPESTQSIVERASALEAMRPTIFNIDTAHLSIRLGADRRILLAHANVVNAFETVRRVSGWRSIGRGTDIMLRSARHRFVEASNAFNKEARRLAASQLR